jgi:hypothetical protein
LGFSRKSWEASDGRPNDSHKSFVGGRVNISRESLQHSEFANGGIESETNDSDLYPPGSERLARTTMHCDFVCCREGDQLPDGVKE